MKHWKERPFEYRALFNPAFCGLLLLRAMEGHREESETGLPFSLAFLILPICLHKDTRDIFKAHPRSYLLKLVTEYPQMLVGFHDRCGALTPYLLEGLGMTMQCGSFKVTDSGNLLLLEKGVRKKVDGTEESRDCQKLAWRIGRDFARINDRITIYSSFGVRP